MTMKTTAWMLPVRKILAFRMSSASYHGFLTSLARSPPCGSRSIGERHHTSLALFSQPAEVEPGVEERRLKTPGRNHCQETHQSKTLTWAHRIDPSSLYATAGTKMSATGTNALCSSPTIWQGLTLPRSARPAWRPSIIPLHASSDGSPSSMHLRSGSAQPRNSTSPTPGQHAISLRSATRTNMLLQEFNCVEGVQDPPADAAAEDDAVRGGGISSRWWILVRSQRKVNGSSDRPRRGAFDLRCGNSDPVG